MEGYPDSGKPEDFTEDQLSELTTINEEDKTKLTKLQKAAIARWKFAKAKAAKEAAAGGAPKADAAAPAAEKPAAKPAAPKPQGPTAAEKAAEEARTKAAGFEIVKKLQAEFGESVTDMTMQGTFPAVVIKSSKWTAVFDHLKHHLGFHYLNNLTAADYLPDRMEMVVHVQNLDTKEMVGVKAALPREKPSIDSLVPIYAGANWLEREVWDMFGIRFEGHPNHTRLLMPDTWEGFPLRKDYDLTREQYISMDDVGNDVVSFKEDEGW